MTSISTTEKYLALGYTTAVFTGSAAIIFHNLNAYAERSCKLDDLYMERHLEYKHKDNYDELVAQVEQQYKKKVIPISTKRLLVAQALSGLGVYLSVQSIRSY